MSNQQNYDIMTKEQLEKLCLDKDVIIETYMNSFGVARQKMLCKKDIMQIYDCESNKAIRILKLMFQMGYGNKIGKEYYISQESQDAFINDMAGKEIFI